ncbi:hypothetical protein W823_10875 [Williamsia sp. D3]|nr:hypothetical protein W823_10875 [Williamsia sp. D3]
MIAKTTGDSVDPPPWRPLNARSGTIDSSFGPVSGCLGTIGGVSAR